MVLSINIQADFMKAHVGNKMLIDSHKHTKNKLKDYWEKCTFINTIRYLNKMFYYLIII